nr:MAG TPA: protein of unknown function (DUF3961) [Crassvirales sp.]DAU06289.1 MAG TPA: protein of unknown function (DUF3961) [Caudoviricetes sp.]
MLTFSHFLITLSYGFFSLFISIVLATYYIYYFLLICRYS